MIPTYDQASVVEKAVRSALDQDLRSLEVVVADDASPDDTAEVVGRISDSRLRYHCNSSNVGRAENYRQTLARLARGKYVLNLDGDDWLSDPTYVRRAVQMLEADEEVAFVFANAWRFKESTDEYIKHVGQNEELQTLNSGTSIFLRYPSGDVWIPHLTAVYSRELALRLNFYALDVIGSDTDSLLRMAVGRKVGFLHGEVAVWRIHETNASGTLNLDEALANFACVDSPYRYALEIGAADKVTLRKWQRAMHKRLSLDFLKRAGSTRQFKTAAAFLWRVANLSPVTAVAAIGGLLEYLASRSRATRIHVRQVGEGPAA